MRPAIKPSVSVARPSGRAGRATDPSLTVGLLTQRSHAIANRYNEATQAWQEADLLTALATQLADDHVAIVMEVGFEKMRYLLGEAHAVNAKGERVSVELDEIYERSTSLGRKGTSCSY